MLEISTTIVLDLVVLFQYTCQNNLPSTTELLITKGSANYQMRHAPTGKVPLHDAAQKGHIECIKVLLLNIWCSQLVIPPPPRTSPDRFWRSEAFVRLSAHHTRHLAGHFYNSFCPHEILMSRLALKAAERLVASQKMDPWGGKMDLLVVG